MSLFEKILFFIQKYNLIPQKTKLLIGLSGGPDSVFLLHVLNKLQKELDISIIAAHLDHEWREQSGNDVIFCKELCQQLGVPLTVGKGSDLKLGMKKSEEQGRIMRRTFLEKIAHEHDADLIAMAHHADDQEETFFIRLIRGTTLSGLVGMQPKQGIYIRPLLAIYKAEILQFLKDNNLSYLIDYTNDLPYFLRNRIRATVIPALRACDDRFDNNFMSTIEQLQAAEDTLTSLTKQIYENIVTRVEGQPTKLSIPKLLDENAYMRNRILMQWLIEANVSFTPTTAILDEIVRFLCRPGSKDHLIHQTWLLRKQKNYVSIMKRSPT